MAAVGMCLVSSHCTGVLLPSFIYLFYREPPVATYTVIHCVINLGDDILRMGQWSHKIMLPSDVVAILVCLSVLYDVCTMMKLPPWLIFSVKPGVSGCKEVARRVLNHPPCLPPPASS
jgi:hypothetical protein